MATSKDGESVKLEVVVQESELARWLAAGLSEPAQLTAWVEGLLTAKAETEQTMVALRAKLEEEIDKQVEGAAEVMEEKMQREVKKLCEKLEQEVETMLLKKVGKIIEKREKEIDELRETLEQKEREIQELQRANADFNRRQRLQYLKHLPADAIPAFKIPGSRPGEPARWDRPSGAIAPAPLFFLEQGEEFWTRVRVDPHEDEVQSNPQPGRSSNNKTTPSKKQ
eukprot:m.3241 g.3241  ORF g.3241 m.3241 type:complete len:225 (-) comp3201_c0_seq2:60-734(-)